MIISCSTLLGIRNVSDKFVGKIKSYVLCSITFLVQNRTVYEITQKKNGTARQDTDDNIIHLMQAACCMLQAAGCRHTLRICNTYCLSTATNAT